MIISQKSGQAAGRANKSWFPLLFGYIFSLSITVTAAAEIHPVVLSSPDGLSVQIKDDRKVIFSSIKEGSGLLVIQPSGSTVVRYSKRSGDDVTLTVSGGRAAGLEISESYRTITADLIERIVTVTAVSDQRYYIDFGWKAIPKGDFYSFSGEESHHKKYTPGCSGPEFGNRNSNVSNISIFGFPYR